MLEYQVADGPFLAERDHDDTQKPEPVRRGLMTSIAHLIEGVAHDVNNSLSNIRLASEVLVEDLEESSPEDPPDTDFLKYKLTNMIGEVDRARAVLGELFQLSRTDGLEKQPLSLKALLNRALAAQRGISDRIEVEMTVEDDLMITGDEHMMTAAFVNVLADALSTIDEAGCIGIRACRLPDGMVEVSVTNSGKALTGPQLEKILEPFFSTKKAGRGKGLGLYVPGQIVKAHEGGMLVESSPCEGTTVRLTLPSREDRG